MSYTRIIESGSYIYPTKNGIEVMFFPDEDLEFIPDTILDVILSKMPDEELQDRKLHGEYIIQLNSKQEKVVSGDKDFFEWRERNVKKISR